MLHQFTCEQCAKPFFKSRRRSCRYCSLDCFHVARRHRLAVTPVIRHVCSVDDCTRPVECRGLCPMHYKRMRAHGDPLCVLKGRGNRPKPLAVRLWRRVDRGAPDACWEWQGPRFSNGRGWITSGRLRPSGNKQTISTARAAWELTHGPIPDGLWVLHRCDNPPCCNPAHLFLGTPRDNVLDMVAKQRHAHTKRSSRRFAPEVRTEAVAAYQAGKSERRVAQEFGASPSGVANWLREAGVQRH